jgi:hypothetical protein
MTSRSQLRADHPGRGRAQEICTKVAAREQESVASSLLRGKESA